MDHKTCFLINIAVLTDNILFKEFNRIYKYKNLEIEIEQMWHIKTNTVPVCTLQNCSST